MAVRAPTLLEDACPDPSAISRTDCEHALRIDDCVRHAVGTEPESVAELRMLELRPDPFGAVHVETEQVLDPVVGSRRHSDEWRRDTQRPS
jgi:hypothetical protein